VAGPTNAILLAMVRRLAAKLLARKQMLATAESCTGGLIAKCVTDLPGSSAWFERGWVTYSDRAKRQEIGVAGGLLKRHGAVSETVARAMARGALQASRTDLSVAVTGIAGPDGGSEDKPVGTVWIAWARRQPGGVKVLSRRFIFSGTRDAIRRQTAAAAFRGLLEE
jgi:nicotinamide-nucleotide amidase